MNINKRIFKLRKKLGWTQKELAQKLKISQSMICAIEKEYYIPGELMMKKIEKVLLKLEKRG